MFKRANSRLRLNDRPGALADYNESLRLNPNSADAYFNRGVVFYKTGDRKAALADVGKAQALYAAAGNQGGVQRSQSAVREIQGAR